MVCSWLLKESGGSAGVETSMNVYTYYQQIGDCEPPEKMLVHWAGSFARHGFTPRVLTFGDVRAYPNYFSVEAMVFQFPTVNDRRYQSATWLRWLAFSGVAPALFCDYDVLNCGFTPQDMPAGDVVNLGHMTIYATAPKVVEFIGTFKDAGRLSKTHVSDMDAFSAWHPHSHEICKLARGDDMMTAKLVHFQNDCVKPEWRYEKRWMAMEALEKQRYGS